MNRKELRALVRYEVKKILSEDNLKPKDMFLLANRSKSRKDCIISSFNRIVDELGYVFQTDLIDEAMKSNLFASRNHVINYLNMLRMEGKLIDKNKMIRIVDNG